MALDVASAAVLEAQLWRAVSEASVLEDCLQRVVSHLSECGPLLGIIIRRLDEAPVRLTTVARAHAPSTGARGQAWRAEESSSSLGRTDVAPSRVSALRAWLTHGTPCWADELEPVLSENVTPGASDAAELLAPLSVDGVAAVVLFAFEHEGHNEENRAWAALAQLALPPLQAAVRNDHRYHEVTRLREALRADRDALLSRLGRADICEAVIGEHGGLSRVMAAVEQVAHTDAPVLILGETGSGKEVIARTIHERSPRCKGPVVRVNCGAMAPELVDSELFGHEKGAFTGAVATRKGWFERADGGTLFLDEIGELPLAAQVRLLRVLQDGSLERVGGQRTVHVDVRIVAATHRDLGAMVAARSFREDLWYRLSVFPIRLPALRERTGDLPALARYFAERAGKRLGNPGLAPSAADIELLHGYTWPGNVRELAAVIERAAILGGGRALRVAAALDTVMEGQPSPAMSMGNPIRRGGAAWERERLCTLDEAMGSHIRRALASCQGRIEGPFGAARVLGINPHTLRARMRKLGIPWAEFRSSLPPPPQDI